MSAFSLNVLMATEIPTVFALCRLPALSQEPSRTRGTRAAALANHNFDLWRQS
ncbi:unnamed protein product, partial [marine sediment metagenome]